MTAEPKHTPGVMHAHHGVHDAIIHLACGADAEDLEIMSIQQPASVSREEWRALIGDLVARWNACEHVNPAAVPKLLEVCRTVSRILTQAVEHSEQMEEGEFLVEVDADWLLRQAGTLRTAIRSTVTEQKGQ